MRDIPVTGVEGATPFDARSLARRLFDAVLAGADPGPATRRAVASLELPASRRVRLFALGKASLAMAESATSELIDRGAQVTGGIVVAPLESDDTPRPIAGLELVAGDHPVPGLRSLAAAERLGEHAAAVRADELALVLVSGGTSSLVMAPVVAPGANGAVSLADLGRLTSLLLASGVDIGAANVVRKRFARWGAGRLAVALAKAARIECLLVSDVPGDDPAIIGSGPCVADPTTAADVRALLATHGLHDRMPPALREHLALVERGAFPETPKPHERSFERVDIRVVAANAAALEHAAARARALGAAVVIEREPLGGEASRCGERIARRLVRLATEPSARDDALRPIVLLLGGETTVTLGDGAGLGGRSQELALAAARALHEAAYDADVVLLAAGTDGRDGPTDAAGALVDRGTWRAILSAGRDPADDLRRHDAYGALDAAGALVRTGPTGTNIMDVAIGIVVPRRR